MLHQVLCQPSCSETFDIFLPCGQGCLHIYIYVIQYFHLVWTEFSFFKISRIVDCGTDSSVLVSQTEFLRLAKMLTGFIFDCGRAIRKAANPQQNSPKCLNFFSNHLIMVIPIIYWWECSRFRSVPKLQYSYPSCLHYRMIFTCYSFNNVIH